MSELKPCPFCGGRGVSAEISYFEKVFRIYCTGDCTCGMSLSFGDAGLGNGEVIDFEEAQTIMQQLTDLWNTRTKESEVD